MGMLQQDSGRRCHPLYDPPSERNRGGLNVMMGFFFFFASWELGLVTDTAHSMSIARAASSIRSLPIDTNSNADLRLRLRTSQYLRLLRKRPSACIYLDPGTAFFYRASASISDEQR
ncbi:hypothetical protein VTN00DRAFT_4033 [Thermoascus crustaceus]|uniref:uncharacterized protein n=1 Tax=Thermoascus crustaceus TaxID=5088 RepID=UPI003742AC62